MSRDFSGLSFFYYLHLPSVALLDALPVLPHVLLPVCQKIRVHSLVLASSSLASLQLIHIPSADRHIARVLVHAIREAFGRHSTVRVLLLVGVVVALLLLGGRSGLGVGSLAGATAAKEATDSVANGGADGNSTVSKIPLATFLQV